MRASVWFACACALSIPQTSFGQPIVVPNDNVRLSPIFLDDQLLNVSRFPSSDARNCEEIVCSYVAFHYENGVLDFGTDQQFVTITGDWYLVSADDIFSDATVDLYPAMWRDGRGPGPPVQVGTSDFYLGVRLNPAIYGWVQLKPIDGLVTMVGNAVSYASRGIVVGTTQFVPEPVSADLVLVGLVFLLQRRTGRIKQECNCAPTCAQLKCE
jgi:hypothetical protein